jgi:tetratricopeptide (TPR) repeat protein
MHGMRLALALVAVAGATQVAAADLAAGRSRLASGDYKGAKLELERTAGRDRPAARLLLARAHVATGDFAAAEATLAPLAPGKDAVGVEARLALAEVRQATGRMADARRDLEQLRQERPDDRAVRTALALARLAQGELLRAKELFDLTIKESDAGALDLESAADMYQLAIAARHTANFQLSNDAFREALRREPQRADIGVAWADLFLQKYAAAHAEQTLEEVFKVNPSHPDAHAAMAEVILETKYDLQAVRHHLKAALDVSPRHARALKARASVEIDQSRWDEATRSLDAVIAVNREDVEAIAMKATIAWLRDDLPRYDAERKRALAINPAYAQLYRIVARSAVREHRYVAAVELEKEAVRLRPDFFEAMAGVGMGYLRLGMEQEGLEWIDRSWVGDQYNARTANTRRLFKETIPKEYSIATTKSFRIRYHNEERPVLSRFLEPTMERAFADMARRYGFTPKLPVTLELYADRSDYAIRTVGLPDLGALGVCFGQVVTAMSPANGDINWGMVMWHELAHVFAIQLSGSRVPRWFTEGLSEYETLIARPEWRRENDSDLYGAVLHGTLPSIAALNAEFMQPDQSAVVVAYYLSAVTIEYLVQAYGFPKIVEALRLFGRGKETPEVLTAITGKSIPALDAEFRKYLDVRLAPYAGTFKLPTRGLDDVTRHEIAADAAPRDAKLRANVALAYYYGGDAEKAAAAAQAAVALDPKQPSARYILAEVALHKGDSARARQLFRGLAADGFDSSDVRARLAQIAGADGDSAEQEKQLCAAKKLDPERSHAYQELAQLYERRGDSARALAELEGYAMLEQMEIAPLKKLAAEYGKRGNWAKVRTYAEMATYIMPQDPEVLAALGRASVELGDGARGLLAYDTMLLLTPKPRRPALVHVGRARALAALGRRAEARGAVAEALRSEPENAEALALRAQLR